jgi:catabolite repression HPr-like protein
MMSMGISAGDTVSITTDGPDEEVALENIEKYLTNK